MPSSRSIRKQDMRFSAKLRDKSGVSKSPDPNPATPKWQRMDNLGFSSPDRLQGPIRQPDPEQMVGMTVAQKTGYIDSCFNVIDLYPKVDQTRNGNVDRDGNQLPGGRHFISGRLHAGKQYLDLRPPYFPTPVEYRSNNIANLLHGLDSSSLPDLYGNGVPSPHDSYLDAESKAAFGQMSMDNGGHLDFMTHQHGMGDHLANAPAMLCDAPAESQDAMVEDVPEHQVSTTSTHTSDYEESDYGDRRTYKDSKINKDGLPRKPRQPRAKLLKWNDSDWKNVVLGIIWACGETGVQIPFHQAAQVVGESCTAGALQQAILKLRGKQLAEGYQIPALRMAWTRKNKHTANSSFQADEISSQDTSPTKNMLPKKKPTHMTSTQTTLVVLKRPYVERDRMHLRAPFKFKRERVSRPIHSVPNMKPTVVHENVAGKIEGELLVFDNNDLYSDGFSFASEAQALDGMSASMPLGGSTDSTVFAPGAEMLSQGMSTGSSGENTSTISDLTGGDAMLPSFTFPAFPGVSPPDNGQVSAPAEDQLFAGSPLAVDSSSPSSVTRQRRRPHSLSLHRRDTTVVTATDVAASGVTSFNPAGRLPAINGQQGYRSHGRLSPLIYSPRRHSGWNSPTRDYSQTLPTLYDEDCNESTVDHLTTPPASTRATDMTGFPLQSGSLLPQQTVQWSLPSIQDSYGITEGLPFDSADYEAEDPNFLDI
ncbi:hypothetical protein ACN47E_003404 [Coniothyrium glycines]